MNKDIAKKWCAALRSGDYVQGTKILHNKTDDSYCCLGVLCELYIQEGNSIDVVEAYTDTEDDEGCRVTVRATTYDGAHEVLPDSVMRWAGINSYNGQLGDGTFENLAEMNDIENYTFEELAEVIEEKVDVL